MPETGKPVLKDGGPTNTSCHLITVYSWAKAFLNSTLRCLRIGYFEGTNCMTPWNMESDGHDHAAIQREIDQLNDALGDESEVQDDLIEKWERQLESGEMPDLDEGLDRG